MRKSTCIIGLVCSVVMLVSFGCSKQQKPESATIQGHWESQESNGNSTGTNSLVLTGNQLEFHAANPQEWYKGTFTLNNDVNPKQMIILITDCPAPMYVGKTANAIYKIEDGTLTIAGNEPGKSEIPASFDSPGARKLVFKTK